LVPSTVSLLHHARHVAVARDHRCVRRLAAAHGDQTGRLARGFDLVRVHFVHDEHVRLAGLFELGCGLLAQCDAPLSTAGRRRDPLCERLRVRLRIDDGLTELIDDVGRHREQRFRARHGTGVHHLLELLDVLERGHVGRDHRGFRLFDLGLALDEVIEQARRRVAQLGLSHRRADGALKGCLHARVERARRERAVRGHDDLFDPALRSDEHAVRRQRLGSH
jgi:hypothetical protein